MDEVGDRVVDAVKTFEYVLPIAGSCLECFSWLVLLGWFIGEKLGVLLCKEGDVRALVLRPC